MILMLESPKIANLKKEGRTFILIAYATPHNTALLLRINVIITLVFINLNGLYYSSQVFTAVALRSAAVKHNKNTTHEGWIGSDG